ncbi:ribonuclease-III-like-domain-containing protein [Mycena sanguinolenta]|nr:ribonuclease-III-like-domain-containing protein [Mycena sanguinolenta]
MSRSLSARCLHRTVFSFQPSPSQSTSRPLPATRQYSYAALKQRPQSDREYPRRRENPPPYSHVVPHEPGVRLQQSWGQSHELGEQEPPSRETETRRLYEDEDGLVEGGPRADVGARDHDQRERGEGSSSHAGRNDRRHASRATNSTRSGPSRPSPPPQKPDQIFAEHLDGIFTPLKFPPELSARVLTHASHPAAFHGHNAQFSFIGRRVLESYLLLLLASSPHLKPSHDLQEIASRVLNTYFLGEHIGSKWGLGRVMRWTPIIAASMLNESRADKAKLLKDVGLYKVQGDAVGAVMGAIFQQFGASVAHRVFHTRVLPRLLLPHGGLPTCFHQDAQEACERLGGVEGDLVLGSDLSARPRALQEQTSKALPSPTLDRQTL